VVRELATEAKGPSFRTWCEQDFFRTFFVHPAKNLPRLSSELRKVKVVIEEEEWRPSTVTLFMVQ